MGSGGADHAQPGELSSTVTDRHDERVQGGYEGEDDDQAHSGVLHAWLARRVAPALGQPPLPAFRKRFLDKKSV